LLALGLITAAHCRDDQTPPKPPQTPPKTPPEPPKVPPHPRELITAAMVGNIEQMAALVEAGAEVDGRHPYGWTALHAAAVNGRSAAVQWLLQRGADANAREEFSSIYQVGREQGRSPVAVRAVREAEFSARLNCHQMFRGFTPLHYAVLAHDQASVRLLMDRGADPTLTNEYGLPPADYAADVGIRSLMSAHAARHAKQKMKRDQEQRRKFPIEQRIKKAIIGQEGAIATVCGAIRRKENGWHDEDSPLVFLFLGSSGIGKTELAKQVADYLDPGRSDGFIRIDMSEYQQKHEVAKLIGSPPGYVGHDDGGQLTKRLRKNPGAVVLFDEVEKAHPDILTVLLQLFDEGRLTDGKGATVACKDAIFIMTSNLASDEIAAHALQLREEAAEVTRRRYGEEGREKADKEVKEEEVTISSGFKEAAIRPILKSHFQRDEFLGRINEIVYFLPFSRSELLKLVRMELERWVERGSKRHGMEVRFDPAVLDILADGYNVHYGARSIKHEVARRVVTQLAEAHESGAIEPGCSVLVTPALPCPDRPAPKSPLLLLKVKRKEDKEFTEVDPTKYIKTQE